MKGKILIADKMHESIIPMLVKIGLDPDYQPTFTKDQIIETINQYVGLIIRSKTFIGKEIIDHADILKFVARAGAGLDNIDEKHLAEQGIQLFNAPEGNRDALGEHNLGLLISLMHNINRSDREVRSSIWKREENRGYELKGKTVGIFGFGNMGSAFAEKLKGLGTTVIAYDKYKSGFGNNYVEELDLNEFLERTEILSIHIPLSEETHHLFNDSLFSRFKNMHILLNTSRGEVVNQSDLLKRLKSGKISMAGLDVLEVEKLKTLKGIKKQEFEELCKMENVILTPHIGGWTFESYQRINQVLVDKINNSGIFDLPEH